MCEIEEKEILITGNNPFTYPFVLNTENLNIRPFPPLPPGLVRGGSLTKFDTFVFHFGGRKQSSGN